MEETRFLLTVEYTNGEVKDFTVTKELYNLYLEKALENDDKVENYRLWKIPQ